MPWIKTWNYSTILVVKKSRNDYFSSFLLYHHRVFTRTKRTAEMRQQRLPTIFVSYIRPSVALCIINTSQKYRNLQQQQMNHNERVAYTRHTQTKETITDHIRQSYRVASTKLKKRTHSKVEVLVGCCWDFVLYFFVLCKSVHLALLEFHIFCLVFQNGGRPWCRFGTLSIFIWTSCCACVFNFKRRQKTQKL